MTVFIGLLRAINVGGTGVLAMKDLCKLCEEAGFQQVRTYIQSGNVLFSSPATEPKVKATLEHALEKKMGKPYSALIRSAAELERVLSASPFPDAEPKCVSVFFLDAPPEKQTLAKLVIPASEEVKCIGREVYVHYPDGQGKSKLKLPFAASGTARNLNTIAKLVAMTR